MSNLIPFQFNTSTIRIITADDGEILFVANDVATTLGYTNPQKAVRDHCKKPKSLINLEVNESFTMHPQTVLITESDVYRLTLRSKLESAEVFQDWLVDDVIPSIRKTGTYSVQPKVELTRLELIQMAMDSELEKQALQITVDQQIQVIKTKDDLIRVSNEASIKAGEILISEFVKTHDFIEVGRNQFYEWMRANNICFSSRNEPYQRYVTAGYFTYRPTEEMHGGKYRYSLRVTPRGKVWLAAKYLAYLDSVGFDAPSISIDVN